MNDNLQQKLTALTCDDQRYFKNVLYITPEQQAKIKHCKILFAGVGLGSVVAEAALRLGFEQFVLIDGDTVELSNLNRQNYHMTDIGQPKVEALKQHLHRINPAAKIQTHNLFLDSPTSIAEHISDCDIAINAIDFDDNQTPFLFDQICQQQNIPVVHPLNFGWAGAAYVVTPTGQQIHEVPRGDGRFELVLIESFLDWFKHHPELNLQWLERFLNDYSTFSSLLTPPQLTVGAHLTAAIVTDILFRLVNGLEVKSYPEPYFAHTH